MKKLLLSLYSVIVLLGGCKSNLSEEPASSPTISSPFSNNAQARSLGDDELWHFSTDEEALLYENIRILKGGPFYISTEYSSGARQYLKREAGNYIVSNRDKNISTPFWIQSPPELFDSYNIYVLGYKKLFLDLGSYPNIGNDLASTSESKDFPNFDRTWNFQPTHKGWLICFNHHIINGQRSILTAQETPRYQDYAVRLGAVRQHKQGQVFQLTPDKNFNLIGIKYLASSDEIRSAIFDKSLQDDITQNTILREQINKVVIGEDDFEPITGEYIKKISELKVVKTYANTSHREVEVDMFFDKTVNLETRFTESSGLYIPTHQDRSFTLPTIVDGSLKFLPNDIRSSRAKYQDQSIDKKLNGMLPLLISPRSEARVEYTYSVYKVRLPYFILLAPEHDYSGKIIKVLGMWEGTIYTELDTDKHRFSKKSLDPPAGDVDEDEEEIDFELSNADINRIKRNEGGFRSASTTQATQRIRL